MAKYKHEWTCPKCGDKVELRKRITVSKRTCNRCGTPITTDEIDSQAHAKQLAAGCLIAALVVIGLFAKAIGVGGHTNKDAAPRTHEEAKAARPRTQPPGVRLPSSDSSGDTRAPLNSPDGEKTLAEEQAEREKREAEDRKKLEEKTKAEREDKAAAEREVARLKAEAEKAEKDEAKAQALLKLGKSCYENKEVQVAIGRFKKVIENYPNTKAAAEAKEWLKKLQ